jgi:phosphoserine phosphatase
MFHISLRECIKKKPLQLILAFPYLINGRAALKTKIADLISIDYSKIKFNTEVITLIRKAKNDGRMVVLATAACSKIASDLSSFLGVFDQVYSSSDSNNLKGKRKALKLIEEFKSKKFDYIGNDYPDIYVWKHSKNKYLVNPNIKLERRIKKIFSDIKVIYTESSHLRKIENENSSYTDLRTFK